MDSSLFHIINQGPYHEVLDNLMVFITNYRFVLFFAVLLPFFLKDRKKTFFVMAFGIAGIAVSSLSVSLLKLLFARPRPCHVLKNISLIVACPDSFSMPSGHAATSCTAAAIMGHFIRPAAVPALFVALLVIISRVYIGVHYPFDVIAGAIWGGVISGAMVYLYYGISKQTIRVNRE